LLNALLAKLAEPPKPKALARGNDELEPGLLSLKVPALVKTLPLPPT